jgi:hypothetical protein
MRNSEGKFIATRRMKATGAVFTGVGTTQEEANFQLRNEIKKYKAGMLQGVYLIPTGETAHSPGFVMFKTELGTYNLRFDPNRKVQVKARPDVAHYIQKGRKDNILKETRQIRRARERG